MKILSKAVFCGGLFLVLVSCSGDGATNQGLASKLGTLPDGSSVVTSSATYSLNNAQAAGVIGSIRLVAGDVGSYSNSSSNPNAKTSNNISSSSSAKYTLSLRETNTNGNSSDFTVALSPSNCVISAGGSCNVVYSKNNLLAVNHVVQVIATDAANNVTVLPTLIKVTVSDADLASAPAADISSGSQRTRIGDSTINVMVGDVSGNEYAGTNNGNVWKLAAFTPAWTIMPKNTDTTAIVSMAIDNSGAIYTSTGAGYTWKLPSGSTTWQKISYPSGYTSAYVSSLTVGSDNNIYAAAWNWNTTTNNEVILNIASSSGSNLEWTQVSVVTTPPTTAASFLTAIGLDSANNIYVGTHAGNVLEYKANSPPNAAWSVIGSSPDSTRITSLALNNSQMPTTATIYAGTLGVPATNTPGNVMSNTSSNPAQAWSKVASVSPFSSSITGITLDVNDGLYAGTANGGVYKAPATESGNWTKLGSSQGINSAISGIGMDSRGNLYAGTSNSNVLRFTTYTYLSFLVVPVKSWFYNPVNAIDKEIFSNERIVLPQEQLISFDYYPYDLMDVSSSGIALFKIPALAKRIDKKGINGNSIISGIQLRSAYYLVCVPPTYKFDDLNNNVLACQINSSSSNNMQIATVNSSSKTITSFLLKTQFGNFLGTITGNNITVDLSSFGVVNTSNLSTDFTTTGTSVTVNGVKQVSGVTTNNFAQPVTYTVTAADGSTQTYTVSVTPMPFRPYPADSDCIMNNQALGATGTCTCIQDTVTKDIWAATIEGPSESWQIANTWANSLNTANNGAGTCGFKKGWGLPSIAQLNTMAGYIQLYDYQQQDLLWLSVNGFNNILEQGATNLWGALCPVNDHVCTSGSAAYISVYGSSVNYQDISFPQATGWAVHSGQ